jgi:HK97 family phage major capsid protein
MTKTRAEYTADAARADAAARNVANRWRGVDVAAWPTSATDEFDEATEAERRAREGIAALDMGAEARGKVAHATRLQAVEAQHAATVGRDYRMSTILRSGGRPLRSAALDAINDSRILNARQQEKLAALVRGGRDDLAAHIVATDEPAYRRAFARNLATGVNSGNEAEDLACNRVLEVRAANEGTNTAGGYMVPYDLDASVIVTAGGLGGFSGKVLSGIGDIPGCDTAILTEGNIWHGASSSSGTPYAYTAESVVFPDSSFTLAEVTLPIFAAKASIPVSYELFADWGSDGFEVEMARALSKGYASFLDTAFVASAGPTTTPWGLFPQMASVTTNPAHVTLGSAGSPKPADIENLVNAQTSDRFRHESVLVMHPSVLATIRESDSTAAVAIYRYSDELGDTLAGVPVLTANAAPSMTNSTTGTYSYAVLISLPGFMLASRLPSIAEVEYNLFDTASTGRPTGQRIVLSSIRSGFGLLDPNFARLLSNS